MPRLLSAGSTHRMGTVFFSDPSLTPTSVGIRSLASYTMTWICGYFFFSSKPAFIAACEVSYSDLNLPSISRTNPSVGRTLADGFLGLVVPFFAGCSAPAHEIIGRTIGKVFNRVYAVLTKRDEHLTSVDGRNLALSSFDFDQRV